MSRADCQKVRQTVRKSGRLSDTHTQGRGDRGCEGEAGREGSTELKHQRAVGRETAPYKARTPCHVIAGIHQGAPGAGGSAL